jgi:hypothetical protein
VTLLHQHQREIRSLDCGGKRAEYVVATLDDIAAANRLAHETLGRCLDEMPPQTRRFLLLLEAMVTARCTAAKMERTDVRFRQREARAFSGWSDFQVKTHLRKLVDLNTCSPARPRGHGLIYELVYDGAGKDGSRFLSGLLDIEKLRRTGNDGAQPDAAASASAGASPCGYDETRGIETGLGSMAGAPREVVGSMAGAREKRALPPRKTRRRPRRTLGTHIRSPAKKTPRRSRRPRLLPPYPCRRRDSARPRRGRET